VTTQINITVSPYHLLPAKPIPATPPTAVSLCLNCGEFADCQHIITVEGYEELTGDYCQDCLTTALILLAQENKPYTPTAADHLDLLKHFIAHRGERGVTDDEAMALSLWVETTTRHFEMLQLALTGGAFVGDIQDGNPLFFIPSQPIEMESNQ
jgi:hypothetical protein